MPRPTRAHGRPGTRVIPAGWAASHALVVAKTYDCQVTIAPPATGTATYDRDQHQTVTPDVIPVYTDAAEIMLVSDTAGRTDAADEDIALRRYEVKLLADAAGIEPGHIVTIDDCPGDPDLTRPGVRLVVDAVERGAQRFSRVLHATLQD